MPTFRVRVRDGQNETVLVENFADEAQARALLSKRGWSVILAIEAVPDARAERTAPAESPPIPAEQIREAGSWVHLPEALAQQHPLHGIGGWTALLLGLLIFGALYGIWSLFSFATMLMQSPLAVALFLILLALEILTVAVIVLILMRSRAFPACFIVLAAVSIGLSAVALVLGVVRVNQTLGMLANLLWLLYVILSTRVNVTFLHRLPRDDEWLKRGLERGAAAG